MTTAKSMAREVNGILGGYVRIHDDIFRFSLRRVLPIPGLFEAIDYCAYERTLRALSQRLTQISSMARPISASAADVELAFLTALGNYVFALHETIDRLLHISSNLCRKSQGEVGYRYDTYNADVKAYHASVEKYTALGEKLNALYAPIYHSG